MNNPLAGTDPTGYTGSMPSPEEMICMTAASWVCAQAQASAAYRSGYAYTSPGKMFASQASSSIDNGARTEKRKGVVIVGQVSAANGSSGENDASDIGSVSARSGKLGVSECNICSSSANELTETNPMFGTRPPQPIYRR